MSWKSLVTAGLLCVLASPVFAAPTMTLTKGGTVSNGNLDANGNWVWVAQVTPDYSLVPDASGTPIAAELGFSANGTVLSATEGSGMVTDTSGVNANPGNVIFGWETLTNLGGSGPCDSATAGNCPVGLQLEPIGNDGTVNQVFSALGSDNATSGALQYLVITADGPVDNGSNPANAAATSTIQVSGAYSGNGRIAQITGGTPPNYTAGNFDTFNGSFTRTVIRGDVNMDGFAKDEDLAVILANFNGTSKNWGTGDLNGDGITKDEDLALLLSNFNGSGGVGLGAGSGAGSALVSSVVPEPASIALIGLGLLGGLGLIRRKR